MNKKTAMQQLLHQMKEERAKLQLPVEWDRCYQAIEMVMENTYIPLEKEQMEDAVANGISKADMTNHRGYFDFDKWYNETYGGEQ